MTKEVQDIIKSFTDVQKQVYDGMMADKDKLKAEWDACRTMHEKVMAVLDSKDIGPRVRLFLMGIASYWSGRKKLMESLVVAMDEKELLSKWVKDVQKANRTA